MTENSTRSTADWQARWAASMTNNYGTPAVALTGGWGAVVTDADGREYLDLLGGIAVNALGHGHPAIAAAVGVHPVYLARAFRQHYGCGPAAYARQLRLERAAALVRTTARPLADIAAACGFVDQSHLTRAFATTFATSPAAYRRRHRR